jgi:hypothetical protein
MLLFCEMFTVFCNVTIVHISPFMTCSTSYCVCDTLMGPWNTCVCVYIYIYICMYVFLGIFEHDNRLQVNT